MKRFTSLCMAALFALTLSVNAYANTTNNADESALKAAETAVAAAQWDVFSKNIVSALHSENAGIQQSAMRMIIQYGAFVDVKSAVFDVMRVYRNHQDESMRRMAVVALGQMESEWAIRFLQRSLQFEDSKTLKHTMKAVIANYQAAHS